MYAGKEITSQFRVDGIARVIHKDSQLDGQAFRAPISGRTYDDASSTQLDSLFVGGIGTLSLNEGKWETVARLSYQRDERRGFGTSFSATNTANLLLSPNGSDSTRSKATVHSTFEFGTPDFVSYVTGFVEGKQETYKNPCEGAPTACAAPQRAKQSRELLGIGGEYRAEIANQLYLSATFRHDANDDFEDSDTYSVAGSWVIPNTGTRPHASFGTGITNPTFTEQFGFNPGTFQGNPDLVPEEAEGWDIGVEQTLLDDRLIADLTYFESTLSNEIFTAFGGAPLFLSTPQNRTRDSDRSGWEGTVRFYPTDDIDLVGTYTNLDATEPSGTTATLGEVRRPENQGSVDASWRIGNGVQLNIGVTYNGEQLDTDFGTFLRTTMDAYTVFRVGASYALDDNWEIYGRIENATDEEYQEVIGYNGSPRAAFIGVRFKENTK